MRIQESEKHFEDWEHFLVKNPFKGFFNRIYLSFYLEFQIFHKSKYIWIRVLAKTIYQL